VSNRKPPARTGRGQTPVAQKRTAQRVGGSRLRDAQRENRGDARPRARDTQEAPRSQFAAELFHNLRQNTYLVSIFAVIVLGVFVLAPQLQLQFQLRQKISDAQAQVIAMRDANNHLRNDKNRWEDPVYVRSQARDRLFYVLPGEISYLVVGADTVNASDSTGTLGEKLARQRKTNQISQSIAQTKNNWVSNLVESVVVAGLDTPSAK
jgi:cell division protein FtsB